MLESVTCIYACMRKGMIHYRVVDEYEGETLHKPTTRRTKLPMTLGQLTDYVLTTCPLIAVLGVNGFDTVEEASPSSPLNSTSIPNSRSCARNG